MASSPHIAAGRDALAPVLLDPDGARPLYEQVFALLRDQIRNGAFTAGDLLPGEQELTKRLGVSRITVKRALNELASAGFVSRQRGRGTIVTYNPAAPVVIGSFENLLESLTQMGLNTAVQLLEVETAPASAHVAALLGVETGHPVQRAVRVRKIEGETFSCLVTHVPAEIARRYDETAMAHRPLLQLLDDAGYRAEEAEQWITAVAASPEVARVLGVSIGSPLLRIERVMRDTDGAGVEALEGFYRPERFQHHMKLTRKRGHGGRDEWR